MLSFFPLCPFFSKPAEKQLGKLKEHTREEGALTWMQETGIGKIVSLLYVRKYI